jgi:hypothetical protein
VVTSPDNVIHEINFPGSEETLFSSESNDLPAIPLKTAIEEYEKELLQKYIEKYGSSRKVASILEPVRPLSGARPINMAFSCVTVLFCIIIKNHKKRLFSLFFVGGIYKRKGIF